MFENPRRGRQARNFTTNVPKILDLKSSSEQIFSENCRWVPLCGLEFHYKVNRACTRNVLHSGLINFFYFSSLNLVGRMHILTCPEFTEYKLSHFFLSPAINYWINKRVEVNKCANRQLNRVPSRLSQLPIDLCPKISR